MEQHADLSLADLFLQLSQLSKQHRQQRDTGAYPVTQQHKSHHSQCRQPMTVRARCTDSPHKTPCIAAARLPALPQSQWAPATI